MANAKDTTEPADALDFDDISPKALWARFKMVITEPNKFFQELDVDADWKDAVVFAGLIAGINGLCIATIGQKPLEGVITTGIDFVFSFGSSGVLYFLAKKWFGAEGDFKGMYRAYAYAMAPLVLMWMPLVGFLASLYGIFLVKLALVSSQDMEDRNAWIVVTIGVVAMFVIAIAVGAWSLVSVVMYKQGAGAVTGAP